MANSRILVAEDDHAQAALLRRYLESERHLVTVVHDGQRALEAVRTVRPDLVVLDVMLPARNGIDVCRLIRRESDVPVIMVTARVGEDDVVLGLDAGADDYVTKPFSPRELAARVRTLLRRGRDAERTVLAVGPLVVDADRHEVTLDGRVIATTPGEFQLLQVLASHVDRTLSRSQLLTHLYGVEHYVTARAIDGHVMNLRRKIEADPSLPVMLLTVYGVGYRLVTPRPPAP